MTAAPRLVCYGNLVVDDLVLPDGSEHPGLIGGDALYAALGAKLFEPRTEMVAPVGQDFPETARSRIRGAGFSFAGLPERALPALCCRVAYDAAGGREWTMHASEDEFDALSPAPEDIPAAYLKAEAHLVLAMTLAAQERLVAWLRANTRGTIALDPQEDYIAGNEARLTALVTSVDVFLPSAEEVRRLAGHCDWEKAARDFSALGPRVVAIKLGAEGCLVFDASRASSFHCPAISAPVVDATGAGDAFCGAFMASLLQDPENLEAAAHAASLAASHAISDYGTAGSFRAL